MRDVAVRVGQALVVLCFLGWMSAMVRVMLDVSTWPFRVAAAATVVFIGYRLWRFVAEVVGPARLRPTRDGGGWAGSGSP